MTLAYEFLFKSHPDPMWVFDPATLKFLEVNNAAVLRYGYTEQEFLDMTIKDIRPTEDVPRLLERLSWNSEGASKPAVWRHVSKGGETFDVEVARTAIDHPSGKANLVRLRESSSVALLEREIRVLSEELARFDVSHTSELMRAAGHAARLGGWIFRLEEGRIIWSDVTAEIHEEPTSFSPTIEQAIKYYVPEHRERIQNAVEACARDGLPFRETLQIITAKGNSVWVQAIGAATRDESGKIISVQGAFQDITPLIEARAEAKKLSDQLELTLVEFRELAEAMPQIVWITRPDGHNIFFNKNWMDYTGLTLEESLGTGWSRPFHPEDRRRAEQAWKDATTTTGVYSIECRLRRADGTYRWWLIRGVPFRDTAGNVAKWFGTCTDIHDLKEAHSRLVSQTRLLERAQDAIIEIDFDLRVLYWNPGAERLYGWTSEEALGRSLLGLTVDDDSTIREATKITLAKGEWFGELEQHTKDGKAIVVESRRSLVTDEKNNPKSVLAINTDITKRRAIESQLQISQKMEAIGQLTGGVAHDFNNILMVIMANVDSVLEDDGTPPNVKENLERIGAAAGRATQLTRQLLAFSRKQTLRPQRTYLNDLVVAIGSMLRRTLGEHIEIESLLAEDLWPTDIDRAQLEAALINLCVNARDALPNGGRILIETKNVALEVGADGRNEDITAGDYVMVSVVDSGSGMPPEVLSKVFEPFFTTKDVGKGTGLGLSMVYGFVKQSKGHIAIDSEVGRGTAIRLYLPRGAEPPAEKATTPQKKILSGGEHILLVEDDDHVRELMLRQLSSLGYVVTQAINGSEGLAKLRAAHSYDLLVTDVVMPGPVNGIELADEATRLYPSMRMVLMSGYAKDTLSNFGLRRSDVTILNKPFRKADLGEAVRRALDGVEGHGPVNDRC